VVTDERLRRQKAERRAAERRAERLRSLGYGFGAVVLIAAAVVVLNSNGRGNGRPASPGSVHVSGAPRSELLAEGMPVPDFSAPGLVGGVVDRSDYEGSPVVLAIWASWCPHCQAELPRLASVMESYPTVKLLSITTYVGERSGPSPAQFMKDAGLTFQVALDDANHTLANAFGVQAFPTVYFVNSDGTIMRALDGEVDDATLRTLIGSLR
jgi:thiol-disulfide isomerase/thioredoxin